MRAKKSLGQHFLKSEKALREILDAGDIHADDILLEIGPGKGVLTEKLTAFGGKVIAIEKDASLIPLLKARFSDELEHKRLEIIEQDILDFDPEILRFYKEYTYKVIANIPYYITGAIIRKFLTSSYQPEKIVLLVQKEVAERIVARDGKESILSISVKAYGKPYYVKKVSKKYFSPPPKVDSAILEIDDISRDFFDDIPEDVFFTLVRQGFSQKRKKLINTLAPTLPKQELSRILTDIGLSSAIRAESLTCAHWKTLVKKIIDEGWIPSSVDNQSPSHSS